VGFFNSLFIVNSVANSSFSLYSDYKAYRIVGSSARLEGQGMKKLLDYKSIFEITKSVIIIGLVALVFLALTSCEPTPTPKSILVIVTASPEPVSNTPRPKSTSVPTLVPTLPPTVIPEPSNTPPPTPTPMPQAEIWSMTLEDAYKMVYALGYSAEMYPTESFPAGQDSWAIHFYDPASFYASDYWFWYGNSVYAYSVIPADPVTQISITKNFLDFPVSGIDEKAEKFYRRILEDLGYEDTTVDEIMQVMSTKLAYAREDTGERLCFGRIETGEYVSVWLEQSDYGYYWYFLDIRTTPICSNGSSTSDA